MKANRKFLKGDDEAVSPVIAVILMVAITVVLAATVYVWVSGFGAQSSAPAKSISLTSNGAISGSTDNTKVYTVSSATPGLKYNDLKLTLEGAALACNNGVVTTDHWFASSGGNEVTCATTDGTGGDAVVQAGDQITVYDDGTDLSGKTLRVLDSEANSVMLTLTIG